MELQIVKGSWEQLANKLKERYPQLSENDLEYKESEEEDRLRMIENKLSESRDEIREIIKEYRMMMP